MTVLDWLGDLLLLVPAAISCRTLLLSRIQTLRAGRTYAGLSQVEKDKVDLTVDETSKDSNELSDAARKTVRFRNAASDAIRFSALLPTPALICLALGVGVQAYLVTQSLLAVCLAFALLAVPWRKILRG